MVLLSTARSGLHSMLLMGLRWVQLMGLSMVV
jgi:hypothetical protein